MYYFQNSCKNSAAEFSELQPVPSYCSTTIKSTSHCLNGLWNSHNFPSFEMKVKSNSSWGFSNNCICLIIESGLIIAVPAINAVSTDFIRKWVSNTPSLLHVKRVYLWKYRNEINQVCKGKSWIFWFIFVITLQLSLMSYELLFSNKILGLPVT